MKSVLAHKSLEHFKSWQCEYWSHQQFEECVNINHDELDKAISYSAKTFKHDRTTTVSLLQASNNQYVLKRYNARTHWHKYKRAFRRSRARRCWKMSHEFSKAGLNVAMPMLMYEKRFGPIRRNAYFANEYLDGDEVLTALPEMSEHEQMQVVQAVKDAFKCLQENKLSHGDMKASNLLWVDKKLYFIDLDAANQHMTTLSWKHSNMKDRKRFLKNWIEFPEIQSMFDWLK